MKSTASERLIGSILIEAFAHATEDPSKVKQAILTLAPGLQSHIAVENLRGYYDNPIVTLRLKVEHPDMVELVLESIRGRLTLENKVAIRAELNHRLDERGALYIRLNKQDLYHGRISLDNGNDVIRLQFTLAPHTLRKYRPEEVYRLCRLTA